jgi:hypothetical protein
MIRYKIQSESPKYIHSRKLYTIKSRGTFYGIHRDHLFSNYDSKCSKTSLLMFIDRKHAHLFYSFLEQQQKQKKMMDRILDENSSTGSILSTSLQPLTIEEHSSTQLEMLCLLHFFNGFIINKVHRESGGICVYGYEFLTYDIPNRQILEYHLYKSFHQT